MSEQSVECRNAAKAKVKRLTEDRHEKLDASGYKVPGEMNTEEKVKEEGKPVHVRAYQRGGPVKGAMAYSHGGRKARAMGGPGMQPPGQPGVPGMQPPQMVGGVPQTQVSQPPVNRFTLNPVPNRMGSALGAFMNKGGKAEGGGNWIKGAVKHKGALHKELGVPEGKKIPEKKLVKAEHSSNPTERKRADLAKTLKGLHKAEGGSTTSPWKKGIDAGKTVKDRVSEIKNSPRTVPDAARRSQEDETQRNMMLDKKLVWKRGGKVDVSPEITGTRPVGGRLGKAAGGSLGNAGLSEQMSRASGGRAKKGNNVTIIIAGGSKPGMGAPGMPPAAMQGPVRPPGMPSPGTAPAPPPNPMAGMGGMPMGMPMGGMGMPPGGAMPPRPGMPPPPMRKAGGRVHNASYPLEDGSGGGEGRLEKAKAYGGKK